MPDILACALWLQGRLGAWVFPVDHPGVAECIGAHEPGHPCDGKRGKHPPGRWSRDSTSNPDVIMRAFGRGPRNIGIDAGRSGLVVIDEDRPRALAEYAAEIGEAVPETFTVTTGRGAHWYFRQPDDAPLGNGRGRLRGRSIDVRGAGGFVVGPGSVHESGTVYAPVDARVPVASLPDWLLRELRWRAEPGHGEHVVQGSTFGRLRGAVAALLGAQEGERNNLLFWSACRAAEMVAAGELGEQVAADVLTEAALKIGLGPGETHATIASGLRRAS